MGAFTARLPERPGCIGHVMGEAVSQPRGGHTWDWLLSPSVPLPASFVFSAASPGFLLSGGDFSASVFISSYVYRLLTTLRVLCAKHVFAGLL